MTVSIVQQADGSLSFEGRDGTKRGTEVAETEWVAASVDKTFFVAFRDYRIKAITARVTVAGTDAGAVSAVIAKVPSGTAIGSGTTLHSGTINLKGTADTNQTLTLSTTDSDLDLDDGQALAINFTGTLTAATGVVCVALAPR